MAKPTIVVLMGTMSSGKTFFGERLAKVLGWPFFEADHFHPAANKEKMRAGLPLTDTDRGPWLAAIAAAIKKQSTAEISSLFTCSALKRTYRDVLRVAPLRFIHLYAPPAVLRLRALSREHEYMNPNLVKSQVNILEDPAHEPDVISINTNAPADEVEQKILAALQHPED